MRNERSTPGRKHDMRAVSRRAPYVFPRQAGRDLSALRELGDWLGDPDRIGFGWGAWGTFTFGDKFGPTGPSPDRAMHHWWRWMGSRELAGCGYFAAVEKGSGGRVHLHALLRQAYGRGDSIPRKALWRSWFNRYGRCQILPYDAELGAVHYITKYLIKSPELWDLRSPS